MTRKPNPQQREGVKVHLDTALRGAQPEAPTERSLERLLDADEGTDNFDPAPGHQNAWCRVVARDIPHGIYEERPGKFVIPPGVSTEAPYILPQHHDQAWVDDVLVPLLKPCLEEEARKRPDALERPLWAFTDASLAVFWQRSKIQASVKRTRSGRALVYVPTLQEAIARLQ